MKLTQQIISINAVLALGFGIAFTLYAPIMMILFGVAEIQEGSVLLYWHAASFARLFGAALFGYGLLLWSIRSLFKDEASSGEVRRGILYSLVFANAIGAFVALTQQAQIWQGLSGWILSALFLLFTVVYGFLLFSKRQEPEILNS